MIDRLAPYPKAGAALLVAALVVVAVPWPALALTPVEARRYGFSFDFSHDRSLSTTATPTARDDPFRFDRIPSPSVPRIAPPERGIPRPSRREGRPLALPVLEPAKDAPVRQKLPPPPKALGPEYERVGNDTCLMCHPGRSATAKRGHLALLEHAAHFRTPTPTKKSKGKAPRPIERAGCESCHGPGSRHVRTKSPRHIFSFSRAPFQEANRICLDCHYMRQRLDAAQWRFSPHAAGRMKCVACHTEHAVQRPPMLKARKNRLCLSCHRNVRSFLTMRSAHPVKDERFQSHRSSVQRGKLQCVDCHDPHIRPDDTRVIRSDRKHTCTRCHPAQRGPFFYEHRLAHQRHGRCLNCHHAHGSPLRKLLLMNGRQLCLRCHADKSAHFAPQSCFSTACHRDIHGSNRDILFRRL